MVKRKAVSAAPIQTSFQWTIVSGRNLNSIANRVLITENETRKSRTFIAGPTPGMNRSKYELKAESATDRRRDTSNKKPRPSTIENDTKYFRMNCQIPSVVADGT